MKWLLLTFIGFSYSLRLFVVPHSHCDAGWLESFDVYYEKKVTHILTNIVKTLNENPDYKFVWSETSFLQRWMKDQKKKVQNQMGSLIKSGRIEIVGGGFSQHDEALSDFELVVRNLETGHKYINDTFGLNNIEVAWQIDSFGHSAISPSIFSKFGYKYMVGSRIDSNFKKQLANNKQLEFVWNGSKLSGNPSILTHILKDGYHPPNCQGLTGKSCCFNKKSPGKACADYFYSYAQEWANMYPTKNVLMLFGDDFTYSDYEYMKQILTVIYESSQIVRSSSEYPDFEIKLATASEYFKAVEESNLPLSVYSGDFLPYQASKHSNDPGYWTGFYTTRPDLKKKISDVHKLTRATEIAMALGLKEEVNSPEASIAIHHDAITGTCRDAVKNDYMNRLSNEKLSHFSKLEKVYNALFDKDEYKLSLPYRVFIVFNSLNWDKEEVIAIRSENKYMSILNWKLENIRSQSIPIDEGYEIYIKIKVPSLSIVTLFARSYDTSCSECSEASQIDHLMVVKDSHYTINFNENLLIDSIESKDGETWTLNEEFWNYPGTKGGFYTYSPEHQGHSMLNLVKFSHTVYSGSIVTIVKSVWTKIFNNYPGNKKYHQTVILSNSKKFTIKIGVFAYKSEEIMVRFTNPGLEGLNWFYTSNSADLRIRKYKEQSPESQGFNMYPVPGGFLIRGKESVLNVFPSFNLGVGMKSPLSFEMLLHRNIANDDGWGMAGAYRDSSFIEHHFDIEISHYNPKEFFKSYFDSKNPLVVSNVKVHNEQISIVSDRTYNEYQVWPFKTHFSFGIKDENAYLSSAVVRNKEIIIRVFNLDSDLNWGNAGFGPSIFFNAHKNYTENRFLGNTETNTGTLKRNDFLSSDTIKLPSSSYIVSDTRLDSGYTPEDWEGFEFTSHLVNYNVSVARNSNEFLHIPKQEQFYDENADYLSSQDLMKGSDQRSSNSEEFIEQSQSDSKTNSLIDELDQIAVENDKQAYSKQEYQEEKISVNSGEEEFKTSLKIDSNEENQVSQSTSEEKIDEPFFELNTMKEDNDSLLKMDWTKEENQRVSTDSINLEYKEDLSTSDLATVNENHSELTNPQSKGNEKTEEELPTSNDHMKMLGTISSTAELKQRQVEQNIKALEYSVIVFLSLIFLATLFYYLRARKPRMS